MSTPSIRRAKPGDEAAIHEAHMRSIREICVKDHGEEEIRGWGYRELGERWIRPIKEGEPVWVIETDSEISGFGYLRILPDTTPKEAHLHALYLTPEATKQGLASQVMNLLLQAAKDSQAEIITLMSSKTAHGFYKRFGFEDTGPLQKMEIAGYPVSCFPMMLALGTTK